jgi:hypothetical protein
METAKTQSIQSWSSLTSWLFRIYLRGEKEERALLMWTLCKGHLKKA